MEKIDNVKCIFIDIDGTINNSQRVVTDKTISVIEKLNDKNIMAVICSGRTNHFTIAKSLECNASNIVISSNGSQIYDYNLNKTLYISPIDKETISNIWKIALENDVQCVLNGTLIQYRHIKFKDIANNTLKNTYIEDLSEIKEDISQCILLGKDREKIIECQKLINNISNLEITNTNINSEIVWKGYFCDINVKGNSKGNAIKNLVRQLNIDIKNTMCFGDSMNDISMFKVCNYKVAMKNASDELKEKANYITEYTNDEDGVARFIEKYVL